MKYFLIAGEASGDLHAAHLMHALKNTDPNADFEYFGGDLMQAVGGKLLKHYREMAYMGFMPVLLHLRTIFRNMDDCKKAIRKFQPDAVIFVDYPGFNLKIAKWVKGKQKGEHTDSPVQNEPHTIYYISPKIWAWKTYRVKSIKKYIDQMLCILPFEVDFYKKYDYPVEYVGNPTVEELTEFCKDTPLDGRDAALDGRDAARHVSTEKPIIALLAGSRRQEIKDNLPAMLEAASGFTDYQLVIAGAPGIEPEYYQQFCCHSREGGNPIPIVFGQTYRLLQQASAALVTSGTATLETAVLRIPQAVCYKVPIPRISSWVFKNLFSCPYISLVNLIAGKTVVKELFGKDFSVAIIRQELDLLLHDENYRATMDEGYLEVINKLGTKKAAENAATSIIAKLYLHLK
jgi:lipid-A-disaccharide synthase